MAFFAILPLQEAVGTLTEAFGTPRLAPLFSVGANVLMLAAVYALHFFPSGSVAAVTQTLFWIFPLFTALLPLLLLLLFGRRPHEKIS